MRQFMRPALAASAALALCLFATPAAQAAFIVTFAQEGQDVVARGAGSFNTSSFRPAQSVGTFKPGASGAVPVAITGAEAASDVYLSTYTGPASLGTGRYRDATRGAGPLAGFVVSDPTQATFFLPVGYVSGQALSNSATFTSQTFASLGLTPGRYVFNWGAGASADTFTVAVSAVAVGAPGGAGLVGVGLAGVGLMGVLARRRAG